MFPPVFHTFCEYKISIIVVSACTRTRGHSATILSPAQGKGKSTTFYPNICTPYTCTLYPFTLCKQVPLINHLWISHLSASTWIKVWDARHVNYSANFWSPRWDRMKVWGLIWYLCDKLGDLCNSAEIRGLKEEFLKADETNSEYSGSEFQEIGRAWPQCGFTPISD